MNIKIILHQTISNQLNKTKSTIQRFFSTLILNALKKKRFHIFKTYSMRLKQMKIILTSNGKDPLACFDTFKKKSII